MCRPAERLYLFSISGTNKIRLCGSPVDLPQRKCIHPCSVRAAEAANAGHCCFAGLHAYRCALHRFSSFPRLRDDGVPLPPPRPPRPSKTTPPLPSTRLFVAAPRAEEDAPKAPAARIVVLNSGCVLELSHPILSAEARREGGVVSDVGDSLLL